jgi:hypothetical protein
MNKKEEHRDLSICDRTRYSSCEVHLRWRSYYLRVGGGGLIYQLGNDPRSAIWALVSFVSPGSICWLSKLAIGFIETESTGGMVFIGLLGLGFYVILAFEGESIFAPSEIKEQPKTICSKHQI